jgi:phage tail-like protein
VAPPPPVAAPFLSKGTYQSQALDSRTAGCQWHRVVVHGEVPAGTRLHVETFCADEEYDADQLAGWAVWGSQKISASGGDQAARPPELDCLVPSPPGRFLWLRLTLLGNGAATPVVRAIEIEFPRLTSLRYLPAVFAAEPTSADFTARFLALFDTTLRGIERTVDTEARLFDPASAPAVRVGTAPVDFLSWLALWIGITFDRSWSEPRRRHFLARAGALFAWRGTVRGLREQLLTLLGWDPPASCGADARPRCACADRPLNCAPAPPVPAYEPPPLILEHFRLRRWLLLGVGRLGARAVLWGQRIVNRTQLGASTRAGTTQLITTADPRRDPLHVYAHRFTVFVPACVGRTEAARKSMENLLRSESPAHTRWDVEYVEPRFRIGVQSMIGFDAVVAGLPPGLRLGSGALGVGTLIASATRPGGPAGLRVGRTGRVGTGSQLN